MSNSESDTEQRLHSRYPPSSVLNLKRLKDDYDIPADYTLNHANHDAVPWIDPSLPRITTSLPISLAHLRCGFRVPLHPFVRQVLTRLKCPPYALFPSGYVYLAAFIHYAVKSQKEPTVNDFFKLFTTTCRQGTGRLHSKKLYYLSSRKRHLSIVKVESTLHDWTSCFVWITPPLEHSWGVPQLIERTLGPPCRKKVYLEETEQIYASILGHKYRISRKKLLCKQNLRRIGVSSIEISNSSDVSSREGSGSYNTSSYEECPRSGSKSSSTQSTRSGTMVTLNAMTTRMDQNPQRVRPNASEKAVEVEGSRGGSSQQLATHEKDISHEDHTVAAGPQDKGKTTHVGAEDLQKSALPFTNESNKRKTPEQSAEESRRRRDDPFFFTMNPTQENAISPFSNFFPASIHDLAASLSEQAKQLGCLDMERIYFEYRNFYELPTSFGVSSLEGFGSSDTGNKFYDFMNCRNIKDHHQVGE